METWRLYFCCLLWMTTPVFCTGKPCAFFSFPTLNRSGLTDKENDMVTLPFHLDNYTCIDTDFKITLKTKDSEGKRYGDLCTIRIIQNTCISSSGCRCLSEDGRYQLSLKTTEKRGNSTQWLWTSDSELIQDAEIKFENLRATLLVEYPPQFNDPNDKVKYILPGQNKTTFSLRAHTKGFLQCVPTKLTPVKLTATVATGSYSNQTSLAAKDDGHQMEGVCQLTGSPPNLTLTVWLGSLDTEIQGHWSLNFTNDAGSATLDFQVLISEALSTTPEGWKPAHSKMLIMGGASALGTVVTIIVIMIVACRKKDTSERKTSQEAGGVRRKKAERELVTLKTLSNHDHVNMDSADSRKVAGKADDQVVIVDPEDEWPPPPHIYENTVFGVSEQYM